MILRKYLITAVATLASISAFNAFAANPTALLTISQADGTVWQENMTGLLVVDTQNNFSLLGGDGTTGLFQNGSFVSAVDTSSHPDFWQWKVDASTGVGGWNWHSAQTNSGATPLTTNASDPWMTSLTLNNAGGHGDPDLSYAFSAVNNSTINQTYTFSIAEEILLPAGSSNVYADIAGGLTAKGVGVAAISPFGANSAIQTFELSSDNGLSFVNASVNIGPAASVLGTSTYGPYASNTIAAPTGQSWNYMQLTSKFTLSANTRASLVGFASITPAVPEPESYAMLIAGLGLVGFISRRRKK